jgi:hypothetical protein
MVEVRCDKYSLWKEVCFYKFFLCTVSVIKINMRIFLGCNDSTISLFSAIQVLLIAFCTCINIHLPMWHRHTSPHCQHSIITGHNYQMERIQLFDCCWVPFHSIYVFQFLIWLKNAKGSDYECLTHLCSDQPCRSGGDKAAIFYRESECLYTSAVTLWWPLGFGCAVNMVCLPTDSTIQRVYGSVCWQLYEMQVRFQDFRKMILASMKTSSYM